MSVHEPWSEDTKADIGSSDSSGDCVIGKSIITYCDSKIICLAHEGQAKCNARQVQQGTLFWSRGPSLQKRLGSFANQAHDGHTFGFIHLEVIRLERAQDTLQIMEGFESIRDRFDDPSEVDVVGINDHVGNDPVHVIPSKKIMEDEVHAQGPKHRGIF